MNRLFGLAVLGVALSGCVSAEQLKAQETARAAALEAKDRATCQSYGAVESSDGFARCMADQRRIRAEAQAAEEAPMAALRARAQAETVKPTFTQVCRYDTMSGPVAITIDAMKICPLNPP